MAHLTPEQVSAAAQAAGIAIRDEDLAEVTLRVNGIVEALAGAPEPPDDLTPFPVLVWEEADGERR